MVLRVIDVCWIHVAPGRVPWQCFERGEEATD